MSATIHAILDRFRQEATSTRDLGDKFEHLIFAYLRTDPQYGYWFRQVRHKKVYLKPVRRDIE